MTAGGQPGPSFRPPAQQHAQHWQGPPGLPPYGQPESTGPRPFIIVVSALLAVAMLLGAGVLIAREAMTAGEAPISGQLVPPNSTEGHGILVSGEEPRDSIPHLIVWEDPQCPACAHYETVFGPVIASLVAEGEITAEVRFAYFLDRGAPDGASLRGAIAMAAADAVGRFDEYHSALFRGLANGERGHTDDHIVDLARAAGIEGDDLSRFEELYENRSYADFVANSYVKFTNDAIEATPTFLVSGKRLRFFDEATNRNLIEPELRSFLDAVHEAWDAGGRQIEAPPEPR